MSKIKDFIDLEVWQKGKDLTITIYRLTSVFPKEEIYGITSQMKRAALSVPANIAEGFGRFHFMDKAKFFLNARGSLYELKSHLLISKALGFVKDNRIEIILQSIQALSIKLNNLINKTRDLKKQESQ
jgi:four helix bundle protein